MISLVAGLLALPAHAQNTNRPLEEIVVTASSIPIEAAKVGSTITVLTMDDLEMQGIQYAADALRYVPGVAVNRTGSFGGTTQLRLRGAEGNHVLVLIDGVEVAAGSSSEFDMSSLLAQGIERIEVLRGPQSGLYGSNAMAGVVSVITASGALNPGVGLSLEAGSFGSSQLGVSARGGSEQRHGAVTLAYRETEGINTSQLGSEKDGYQNLSLSSRGELGISDVLTLSGMFRFTDREADTDDFDFTGGPNQGLSIDDNSFSDTVDTQLTGAATWSLRDGGWITRLSGIMYEGEEKGDGSFGPFGRKTTRKQLKLQTTVELGTFATRHAHFITGFVEREEEGFRNTVAADDPSQIPELQRGLTGIGIEYRTELADKLFLSGAIRHDQNEGFDNAGTFRLTAAYLPGDDGTRVHASYGTGVTNPTFFEQFGFIPGSFVGNPDLKPEKARGWDLGIEQRFAAERMVFDITYFDTDLEDEIIDVFPTVANDTGISKRHGVELTLTGGLSERFTLGTSFTYTDAEDPDGTEEVRRPRHMASLDLRYRSLDGRANFFTGMIYNGQMLDNDFRNFFVTFEAEKTPINAYTLVNVGGSYRVRDHIEVYGRIDNLLDEDYEEQISYNTPSRGIFAGIRWNLSGR